MSPKRVGFLIYPAMQALDLVGPMDAFSAVALADGKGRPAEPDRWIDPDAHAGRPIFEALSVILLTALKR